MRKTGVAEARSKTRQPQAAVHVTIALLVLITALFAAAFVAANAAGSTPVPAVMAGKYATEVSLALGSASAAEGEVLIEAFQCGVCHILGDRRVAPRFEGIAERAGKRRANLPAAQYLLESIVHPGAYLVESYANAMPGNYAARLTNEEIGHIIAYLLTR